MTQILSRIIKRRTIALLLLCIVCKVAYAFNETKSGQKPQPVKTLTIPRIVVVPKIDGVLQPQEWQTAVTRSDMLQVNPIEFSAPSQKTTWYFAIDKNTLYVAATAYDSEPKSIVARTLRQGADIEDDDSMYVVIDGFNNKRSGFTFGLNANGVRFDGIYSNGTQLTDAWEGIWQGAARITEDGWQMEMAIPFNTLTFDPNHSEWGLNFWRRLPRNNEEIAWVSRSGQVNPTTSGVAAGFADISQGLGLDVTPSISYSHTKNHIQDISDNEANPSIDINYKLTSSLSALLTINTDFAATEIDDRQLGVQRFDLFFPEKRSFFLTDFDIFQFGGITNEGSDAIIGSRTRANGLPFFSRKIGLSPVGEAIDIRAGTKLSGRIGALDVGALYIRQNEFNYLDDDSSIAVDAGNLGVARFSTGILGESSVGAIVTQGDPGSNLESATYGVDFNYRNTRMPNNKTLEGQFWVQQSDNENVEGDDFAFNIGLGLSAQEGLAAGAQYHEVRQNFDPKLGFVNRRGVRAISSEIEYATLFNNRPYLQRLVHKIEAIRWEFLDSGEVQTQEILLHPFSIDTPSGDKARIIIFDHKETLLAGENPLASLGISTPSGQYNTNEYFVILESADHRRFAVSARARTRDLYHGQLTRYEARFKWRPNKHIFSELRFEFRDYDFDEVRALTRQISWRSELSFNAKWSLVNLLQFDNLSNKLGFNARIRYNPRAGQDLFLVLDHLANKLPGENRFESEATTGVVRLSYTLRY